MPKLPGVHHLGAVKALEKAGFRIDRQSRHIFMSKGVLKVVIPPNAPVDAYTMAAIVRDARMAFEPKRSSSTTKNPENPKTHRPGRHEFDHLPGEELLLFKFPALRSLRSLRLANCGLQAEEFKELLWLVRSPSGTA